MRNPMGKPPSGRSGFTMIELALGVVTTIVAMLAFAQVVAATQVAATVNHEVGLAQEAGRLAVETLQATEFDEIFARFNDDPADDPGGAGTAPGSGVAVPGLDPVPGDPDGFVGQILFPTLAGAPGTLREDVADVALGTPRDLNGDGDDVDTDVTTTYRVLPVVVRFAWQGKGGRSNFELRTLLGNYQ